MQHDGRLREDLCLHSRTPTPSGRAYAEDRGLLAALLDYFEVDLPYPTLISTSRVTSESSVSVINVDISLLLEALGVDLTKPPRASALTPTSLGSSTVALPTPPCVGNEVLIVCYQ